MKTINEATPDDVKQIKYLTNLKSCTHFQAKQIESYLQQFVDASTSVCSRCPSQVRFAHSRLKNFYLQNESELNAIKNAKEYQHAEKEETTEKKVGDVLKNETTEVQSKPETLLTANKTEPKRGRPKGSTNKEKKK